MKDWLKTRNALGVVFLYLFWNIARAGGSIGGMLIGMSFLILAAMCFSGNLRELCSRPFTLFIDTVYFGNNDREPPPLNLRLPGAYRADARYEDAIAEYERQLEYHPHCGVLWKELIQTAREAGDTVQARRFLTKALRRVKRGERAELEREFSWL
jgi:tetratricopeptide (TPR) repeat protein